MSYATHKKSTATTINPADDAQHEIDSSHMCDDAFNVDMRVSKNDGATTKKRATKKRDNSKSYDVKTKSRTKTFTTCDIAREYGMNAKTLRAKIRRNIDAFETLFENDTRHVFRDNKKTRARVLKLLNIAQS